MLIHIRLVYCNLSRASIDLVEKAVKENTSLIGFTCFGQADKQKCNDQVAIETLAPLQIFQNNHAMKVNGETTCFAIQWQASVHRFCEMALGKTNLPEGVKCLQL